MSLPSPARESLHALGIKYAEATINKDWPMMQMQLDSPASEQILKQMWKAVADLKSSNESISVDHLTIALKELSERRNLRAQELRDRMPGILWILLVVGGGVTVGSACLLGNANK